MSRTIVLAGAVRTAIGKMGGALSGTPAATLGSIVIKEALSRANVAADQVDEVLMGCVLQAAQGQNVARQAAIKAGLPIEVPALTLNNVCGSGLKCVNTAAAMIAAGDADIIVAGGMENMSMAPYALPQARFGYRMNLSLIHISSVLRWRRRGCRLMNTPMSMHTAQAHSSTIRVRRLHSIRLLVKRQKRWLSAVRRA